MPKNLQQIQWIANSFGHKNFRSSSLGTPGTPTLTSTQPEKNGKGKKTIQLKEGWHTFLRVLFLNQSVWNLAYKSRKVAPEGLP